MIPLIANNISIKVQKDWTIQTTLSSSCSLGKAIWETFFSSTSQYSIQKSTREGYWEHFNKGHRCRLRDTVDSDGLELQNLRTEMKEERQMKGA